MIWLDCHDVDSTLASLTAAARIDRSELEQALLTYDEGSFDSSEDPEACMPREVLEQCGSSLADTDERFRGAFYFHGTRAIDPSTFSTRGILPLNGMVEELWLMLRQFAAELSDRRWAEFRESVETDAGEHDGDLYRLKIGHPMHYGPHGELVREVFLDPRVTQSHDYLGCPEIIQDIARCCYSAHGIDLERRFCDASVACLVKFRGDLWRPGAVKAALWYAYLKLRREELGRSVCGGHAGRGQPVLPADVVNVEVIRSWTPSP